MTEIPVSPRPDADISAHADTPAHADAFARADALERGLIIEARERTLALAGELTAPGPVQATAPSTLPAPRPWAPLPVPGSTVAIIVPVHNAFDELLACFRALARHTTVSVRLVFVDDASTDPRVAQTLVDWQRFTAVEVLRNSENQGFSATVNRGLRATPGCDVVILNSDTAVTPRWLERMIETAYSDSAIATVTPLSDNAGAFSVPRIGGRNLIPGFLDIDDTSRLIAQHSGAVRPGTPTANGFCMYVKRAMLDDVGHLDGEAFPRGYGEENDLCMRAVEAGWRHAVDDRVFIQHVREASFGSHRVQLMVEGRAVVDARHPTYTARVREFVGGPMNEVRATVARAYDRRRAAYRQPADPRREVRARILFVVHEGRGGTPATNLDLMRELEPEYDCLLLTSTSTELTLSQLSEGTHREIDVFTLERRLTVGDFSRPDYRATVSRILDRRAIELIHIRHLFKHTLDLPVLAAARGIPVVQSFHDFYFVCPTVHLVDDRHTYCAGVCTPGLGVCELPFGPEAGTVPALKHRFVHQWRSEVQNALAGVDAFVTTSPHARDVHLTALPALEGRRFAVIEHGRDLPAAAIAVPPLPGGPVRIAVPGNLDRHKGAEYMRAMLAHDRAGRIRFHLLGDVDAEFAELGQVHGRYQRDRFPEALARTAPAFVGIFAIWAETYSHILSEAWAAGVPVLATGLGALRERIDRHGGGWLLDPHDPRAAVQTILALADDPEAYQRGLATATTANVRSVAEMSADYSALYREVLDGRRAIVPRRPASGNRHFGRGVLRAEVVLPGDGGNYPGSSHVRLLRRLHHPSVRPKLQASMRHGSELSALSTNCDVVIVQRTAVPHERVDWFVAQVADRELPLVLDLDDDLFALGRDDEEYGHQLESLERLLAAASLVTVSTPTLERLIAARGAPTLLLANMIDERLFLAGDVAPPASRPPGDELQAVYVAGPTHGRDLTLLEPVFARLRREGVPVALTFVARLAPDHASDWYRPLPVPRGHGGYPTFVRWLSAQRHAWDFAVAPLVDTEFNRSKSDLKFLEYAALGLPGVYSDLEPYATVSPGVTGLLVDNRTESWCEGIRALAADPGLRFRMAESALEYVQGSRLMRHGADRLLSALFDIVAERRVVPAASPVRV